MSTTVDTHGKPYNRSLLIAVLLIGTFCTVLNQTILTTAFPTLMKDFNITTSTVQWLTTGFMLVNGIMIPVSAWLSSRISTKWLYLAAMSIFEIGTIICWTAPNFGTLLAGRLIQAVGVGVTMPLLQTIMLTIFPADKRGAAMGTAGIVIGLAPAIGPTLSGWVIDNLSWRDLFGLIVPIVAIVMIAGFFFMANVLETSKPKLDFLSLVLSTAGFGSLLYGFSSVGDNGWTSAIVLSTLIIGVILIAGFVWRQLTMKNPFLELRVFKHAEFTVAAILSAVANMAMVGAEMVIPLYLQIIHGFTAFESGLSLLAGALMMGIMSPITGRAFDRFGARRLSILGMLLLTVGTIPFAFITRTTPTVYIVVLYALRMFGIAMVMMPATTAGMNALPVDLMGHGTAVNNTTRQIASSIGTAILTSVLSNVTDASKPVHSMIKSNPLGYQDSYFNATLNGYHAAFWVAVAFSVIGLVVAFFMKDKQHSVKPVAKEVND